MEPCGVCSGRHPTSECISALKRGERPVARCPNCGKGHHVWSKLCPERLRRLPPSRDDGRADPRKENRRSKPLPAAPLDSSHEVRDLALDKRESPHTHATTAATATSTAPPKTPKRRKRCRAANKARAASPASTTPTTAAVGVQTDPLPPPPLKEEATVQTDLESRDVACQAQFGPDVKDPFFRAALRHALKRQKGVTTQDASTETCPTTHATAAVQATPTTRRGAASAHKHMLRLAGLTK